MSEKQFTCPMELRVVKAIHTLVWAIMASAVFYVLYVGVSGEKQGFVWLAVGLIGLETGVLLINRWRCPLSDVAARYTEEQRDNFDIYLPQWLARHNKTIFGIMFGIGLLLVLLRSFLLGWNQG
jgi:hypothetical protein